MACPGARVCYIMGLVQFPTPADRKHRLTDTVCGMVFQTVDGRQVCYTVGEAVSHGGLVTTGTLSVTTDGGRNWRTRYDHRGLNSISCPSVRVCFVVGEDVASGSVFGQTVIILDTHDRGNTWQSENPPVTRVPPTLIAVACPQVSLCFAAGHAGTVLIRNAR